MADDEYVFGDGIKILNAMDERIDELFEARERIKSGIRDKIDPPEEPHLNARKYDGAEWSKMPEVERDYLLGNIISTTSRIMIYGSTGVGKTLFTMDLAAAIATGNRFLNWGKRDSARVLYIEGELPRETVRERVISFEKIYGKLVYNQIWIICRDLMEVNKDNLDPLNTEIGQKWLYDTIEAIQPSLVIFDSIFCLLDGDMKEPSQWEPVKLLSKNLSCRNIAQIWIHHTGANCDKQYGDTTRTWEMDLVIRLNAVEGDGTKINMVFEKNRLKNPDNWEEFQDCSIERKEKGWVIVGSSSKMGGDMISKYFKMAFHALIADGKYAKGCGHNGHQVMKVNLTDIRRYMKDREHLDSEDGVLTSSGRKQFQRAKGAVIDDKEFTGLNGWIWKI